MQVPDAVLVLLEGVGKAGQLLTKIIESQTINDQVVSGLISFAVNLHNKLLRTNNRKKLIYSLKLFNKIMSRLPKEGKKVAGNSNHKVMQA